MARPGCSLMLLGYRIVHAELLPVCELQAAVNQARSLEAEGNTAEHSSRRPGVLRHACDESEDVLRHKACRLAQPPALAGPRCRPLLMDSAAAVCLAELTLVTVAGLGSSLWASALGSLLVLCLPGCSNSWCVQGSRPGREPTSPWVDSRMNRRAEHVLGSWGSWAGPGQEGATRG